MKDTFTFRSLLAGTLLCLMIGAGDVYNLMVTQGSYMTLDFTTPAAIFLLFWVVVGNTILNKLAPRFSFSPPELILICIMMMVAASIPTMGLTLYLVPLLAGTKYFATDVNQWPTTLLPHIRKWLILQDDTAIRWFYEGLPKGESIPWLAWLRPLAWWVPLIVVLYLVMTFIMVILRKQWVEKEKLNYPMTKAPLELIHATSNRIFRNRLFWLGFLIPFVIGCINAGHFYQPLFPQVLLSRSIGIFRRTVGLQFYISFPMIGFTYFVSLPLAFSLWFFCLFTTCEQGFFNITGFEQREFLPYNADRPILGWQAFGALLVIVLYGLWISRHHLIEVCKKALARRKKEDHEEIVSLPVAFWGTALGLLFILCWLVMSGLSPFPALVTVFFTFVVFIGITRVVAEGGLAATRAPVIAPVATTSLFGSGRLGPSGLSALGLMFVYASDVRTFTMASVANGLKMLEEVRRKKLLVFWAIMAAVLAGLFSSIWTTIYLGYRVGAINANAWFFIHGPQYPWTYAAEKIKSPGGTDWLYLGFTGIGAALAGIMLLLRTRFFWFPFHPLGFAFSTIMMTNALWFSIFLAWLVKALTLKYGGAKVYEQAKPFFIGLIVGQFVVSGTWLIIDFFAGRTGNNLFWA